MQELRKFNFLIGCSVILKISLKIYCTSINVVQIACCWIKSDSSTEITEKLKLLLSTAGQSLSILEFCFAQTNLLGTSLYE